jgi:hypothetical protein
LVGTCLGFDGHAIGFPNKFQNGEGICRAMAKDNGEEQKINCL